MTMPHPPAPPRPLSPMRLAALLTALLAGLLPAPWTVAQQCAGDGPGTLRGQRDCALAAAGRPAAQEADTGEAAAAPTQEMASFVLQGLRFEGNTAFGDEGLAAQLARWHGAIVRFADIEQMSQTLTDHYRRAGYPLAHVVAAPQEVRDGMLRFHVFEGRLGAVRIDPQGDSSMPEALVAATLAPLRRGEPLRMAALERAMLLLGDVPGLAPQASLESSDVPGSFDLIVAVNAAPRVVAGVDVDNHGTRFSGQHRLGAFARVNNLLGMGDSLDARVARSIEHGQTTERIVYAAPLPQPGLRAGIAYSRAAYELGEPFAMLGASGRADITELSLLSSLLRTRKRNLAARFTFERKLLRDEFSALAQHFSRKAMVFGAMLEYESQDSRAGGGYTGAMLSGYLGRLSFDSADALAADQSASGPRAQGRYTRVLYRVTRLQTIDATSRLFVSLSGQWANRNLDGAEKIALGGPYAVRAYSTAAGLGDHGQLLKLEYRFDAWPHASFGPFFDAGRVRISRDALPGVDNHRLLKGAGFSLAWEPQKGLSLAASLAWRMGRVALAQPENTLRLYAQLRKVF